MKKFLEDFKAFAMKGNVLDMAIGVVMGSAFGAIVTSLVEKIIMPLVGILVGGINIQGLAVEVGSAKLEYGAFLQAVINFLIIALSIFIFIRIIGNAMSRFKKEEVEEEKEEEKVDPQIELLKEIRDLLKEENK